MKTNWLGLASHILYGKPLRSGGNMPEEKKARYEAKFWTNVSTGKEVFGIEDSMVIWVVVDHEDGFPMMWCSEEAAKIFAEKLNRMTQNPKSVEPNQ